MAGMNFGFGEAALAAGSIGVFAGMLGAGNGAVDIPDWNPVDLGTEAAKATKASAANLPAVQKLQATINAFQSSELMKGMERLVPGSTAALSRNIIGLLQGQLPQDTLDRIASAGAARGLSLGTPGTGFTRNLTLRDLGISTLQAQAQGLQQLMGYGQLLAPQLTSPMPWLVNAERQAAMTLENRDRQWQVQLMRNQQDALPPAWSQALIAAGSTLAGAGATMMSNPSIGQSLRGVGFNSRDAGFASGYSGGVGNNMIGNATPAFNENGMTIQGWEEGWGSPMWGE